MAAENITRRPIAARNTGWARGIAVWLARRGIAPNTISIFSVVAAMVAGMLFITSARTEGLQRSLLFLGALVFIQLRLLCNLFDGMVAVEGGLKTRSGEIYNELPDRISDLVLFACAGYATPNSASSHVLGWAAACVALLTAYVRSLGASTGAGQEFCGPMAKQQRMFLLSLACVGSAIEEMAPLPPKVLPITLACVIVGGLYTSVRRAVRIVRKLENP